MRIAQIVLSSASAYERKSQNLDFETLREHHDVVQIAPGDLPSVASDLIHVYGSPDDDRQLFRAIRTPYVAASSPQKRRFELRHPRLPARIVSPLSNTAGTFVPEAVGDRWFEGGSGRPAEPILGTFARPSIENAIEQTLARIHRFRDDVTWKLFDAPPTPEEMDAVSVWVDPATKDADYDGFVAEAIARRVMVVAARTPINAQRLENGRTGFLVPPEDPNELTHAILAALFKPEAAREREIAARQTASKFRVRQRVRALLAVYQSLSE